MRDNPIIGRIKKAVKKVDPNAEVILYGSYARGDQHKNSDIDLLILVDKHPITIQDQKEIEYPIYEIEFETGILIQPIVVSRKEWHSRHRITPFYENVTKEGLLL